MTLWKIEVGLSINLSGVLLRSMASTTCGVHSVWFGRDVRRIDFVVIFLQWTQNWTALNFEVNFQPLIQLNSRGSQNNSWKGH